ncbi:MAG: hypothetical protein VKJ24_04180 [Synechococcales bacterium]|nr:hypothetical protein [Synechococcales bacterium]
MLSAVDCKPMSPVPNRPQPPKSPVSQPPSAEDSAAPLSESSDPVETGASPKLVGPPSRPKVVSPPPEAEQPATPKAKPESKPDIKPIAKLDSKSEPSAPSAAPPPAPEPEPEPEPDPFEGRIRPIPAPSEPMQYRAIGLVRGKYVPSEEQFTRGEMITNDGAQIEAVLLGRVMSLVKNHVSLEEEHLWVVYPRTREQESGSLHLQVVGIWEPENLSKPSLEEDSEEITEMPNYVSSDEVDDNYFSIRGEIIFHAPEANRVVVRIQQALRKKSEKDTTKSFKLNLVGDISGKVIGYFWDFHVRRQGQDLMIDKGTTIAMIPPRKRAPGERGRRPPGGMSRRPGGGGGRMGGGPPREGGRPMGGLPRRPMREGDEPRESPPREKGTMQKPVIKKRDRPEPQE